MTPLLTEITAMSLDQLVPLIRACGHYLNLTGIAEVNHMLRVNRQHGRWSMSHDTVFTQLLAGGLEPAALHAAVSAQVVEVVLTAHPTQVNRRTLQYKHQRIASFLERNDRPDLGPEERDALLEELVRELLSLWQTDELRRRRPTPMDEARGGLHIVEQSLWAAVPAYLRRLSGALKRHTGKPLPLEASPIRFASWMGGDRDGNPNVTAKVTHHVACLSRWMAADLYIHEIDALRFELSMGRASPELVQLATMIEAQDDALYKELHKQPSGVAFAAAIAAAGASDGAKAAPGGAATGATPSGLARTLSRRPSAGWDNDSHPPQGMVVSTLHGGAFDNEAVHVPHMAVESDPHTWRGIQEALAAEQGENSVPTTPSYGSLDCPPSPISGRVGRATSVPGSPARESESRDAVPSLTPGLAKKGPGKSAGLVPVKTQEPQLRNSRSMEVLLNPPVLMGGTPYRTVLGHVRAKLVATRHRMEDLLSNANPPSNEPFYASPEELVAPLRACYESLHACGAGAVAEGRLADLIRRVYCFGLALLKLDLRQEAPRHTEALDAVTQYLGLGSYALWDEQARITWLAGELAGRRPLVPHAMPVTAAVREVLETFRVAAELGTASLGAYVISMASSASDVLAVELLQREARAVVTGETEGSGGASSDSAALAGGPLRVVPLFETLADLQKASAVLHALFSIPWYRQHLHTVHGDHQEVMLGYSDSGKDAGRLAAAWALYTCQEQVVDVCKAHGIGLTLFHGRGGSIGRGGGPMHLAIQSQPPGSVHGSLRVTEQGEMVQAKFGLCAIATRQLEIFSTAVLLATVSPPPPAVNPAWRTLMDKLGEQSCEAYRRIVVHDPLFFKYFEEATPESELGNLNIGSRPARRKAGVRDIASLRAIPWIFAWTQSRSVLPAWLGMGAALSAAIEGGELTTLHDMYEHWPFFRSTIDLVDMILSKADMRIQRAYEDKLCSGPDTLGMGAQLRESFQQAVDSVLAVAGHKSLSEANPQLRRLIDARAPHISCINLAQAEVLRRLRQDANNAALRDALLVSINGIAAGMRNTG